MGFFKEWTFYVCITVMASVILSFLAPKSNLGNFFKIIISVLIFLSFLYPFSHFNVNDLKNNLETDSVITNSNNVELAKSMIIYKIDELLKQNSFENYTVDCDLSISDNNEITVNSIVVTVDKEDNINEIKTLIYDNLQLNVSVVNVAS